MGASTAGCSHQFLAEPPCAIGALGGVSDLITGCPLFAQHLRSSGEGAGCLAKSADVPSSFQPPVVTGLCWVWGRWRQDGAWSSAQSTELGLCAWLFVHILGDASQTLFLAQKLSKQIGSGEGCWRGHSPRSTGASGNQSSDEKTPRERSCSTVCLLPVSSSARWNKLHKDGPNLDVT